MKQVFFCLTDEILFSLQQLPHAEEISLLVETGNYDDVISFAFQTDKNIGARTAALWTCWMGRNSLLDKLLKLGVDPNCSDDAGRYTKRNQK